MPAVRTYIIGYFLMMGPYQYTWHKMYPKTTQQRPPRWGNIAPRWANIGPRWSNIGAKRGLTQAPKGQHRTKMGQHGPKLAPQDQARSRCANNNNNNTPIIVPNNPTGWYWPALVIAFLKVLFLRTNLFLRMIPNQCHTDQLSPTNCHQPLTQTFFLAKLLTCGVIRSYNC